MNPPKVRIRVLLLAALTAGCLLGQQQPPSADPAKANAGLGSERHQRLHRHKGCQARFSLLSRHAGTSIGPGRAHRFGVRCQWRDAAYPDR